MVQISPATVSACASPTPLKIIGDAAQEEKSVYNNPLYLHLHQAIEMSDHRNILSNPLVLSFSSLFYSVEISNALNWQSIFLEGNSNMFSASIRRERESKVLLNDVSGEVRDGEILCVLGHSGSGKSTLLDALANRIVKDSLNGTITLNGEKLDSRLLKAISAYVMQDDLLFPMLTIEETLMFAAELRLPRTLSKFQKKKRVQHLIDQLDLRNAANTVIGDEGHRGVSGGERRRVSIGIDTMRDPILLFLDEPTSGLDSTSAYMVVKVLQKIAKTGSIVLMSIHQPSYRILGLLDRLIFLSRGQVVYSGSPFNMPSYFEDFGHPIPEDQNPAEAALDLICDLESLPGGIENMVEFNRIWQEKKIVESGVESLPTLKESISSSISRGKLVSGQCNYDVNYPSAMLPEFANPFWIEIMALSKRSFLNSWRAPELFAIRFGTLILTGIILTSTFWKLDHSPRGNIDRIKFLSFVISVIFYACGDGLAAFLQERDIFLRESAYNTYRKFSYWISHALVWLPSLIFFSITIAAITFWGAGLEGGSMGFFVYFLIILASFWVGNSFITFLTEIVPHVMLGYSFAMASLGCFFFFCGQYINRDRIPHYWIWFHYLSPMKYPFEALLQNEFENPDKCFLRGIQAFDNTPLSTIPISLKEELMTAMVEASGMNITSSTCIMTGPDILKQQGVTVLSKWDCIWITIAWGFFFRILFYFSLLLGSKNRRK